MADRIIGMRTALRENLEKLGSPLSWEHITKQVCYLLDLSSICATSVSSSLETWIVMILPDTANRLACSALAEWPLNKLIAWQVNSIFTWRAMVVSGKYVSIYNYMNVCFLFYDWKANYKNYNTAWLELLRGMLDTWLMPYMRWQNLLRYSIQEYIQLSVIIQGSLPWLYSEFFFGGSF